MITSFTHKLLSLSLCKGIGQIKATRMLTLLVMTINWGLNTGCTSSDSEIGATSSFDKALTHYRNGEFDNAIRYAQKYIKGADDKVTLARAYVLLGMVYDDQQNYDKAIQYYTQGLSVRREALGEIHPSVGEIYNNLGITYKMLGNYQKALKYYTKGLELQTENNRKASIENNISVAYMDMGKYNLALQHGSQALEGYPKEKKHFALNNIGLVYQRQEEYQKAEDFLIKTLEERKKYLSKNDHLFSKAYNNLGFVKHKEGKYQEALKYYQKALGVKHQHTKTKLESLQYKATTEKSLKKNTQALRTLKQADKLISQTRKKLRLESDKIYFSQRSAEVNKLGIYTALESGNEAMAFYFSGRNKANVLAEAIEADPVAGIPQIRARLTRGQALVEYTMLDSTLLAFVITKKGMTIEKIPYDFSRSVRAYQSYIQGVAFKELFLKNSYQTYQGVFQPLEKHLRGIEEVILVPDGELAHISFDALVRSDYHTRYQNPKPGYLDLNFRGYDYLIDHYMFVYAPSSSLAFRKKTKDHYRYDYAGFAPAASDLQYNVKEIKHCGNEFENSLKYTGWWATKKTFQGMPSSKITHFSTHSVSLPRRKKEIGLAMYRDTLTLQDIQQTDLQTDLAILSSCFSSQGRYVEGEGYINLVRHFVPKSNYIVYSLFDISDRYAYGLMNIFTENIAQGMSYKKALHQAKRTVLHQKESVPYTWAYAVIAQ